MTANHPTVSVIVPARDAAETLPRTLESIATQTYDNVVDVVVAAADETSRNAAGDAVVVMNPTGSTAVGLNLALARTTGDVVVRCDAHAFLPPNYVETAVATLLRTGADHVGGVQVPEGGTVWERAIGAAMSSRLGAGDARYRLGGGPGDVETVYLGVFKRSTLERLGGYDETFMRTQDYELNHRIIASGGRVWFDPMLQVAYRPRGSLRALGKQYFQYGQAKRQFARKHPGSLRARQWLPPLLVIGTAGALRVLTAAGEDVTIPDGALAAGVIHPLAIVKVFSTSTTAANIVRYWTLG